MKMRSIATCASGVEQSGLGQATQEDDRMPSVAHTGPNPLLDSGP